MTAEIPNSTPSTPDRKDGLSEYLRQAWQGVCDAANWLEDQVFAPRTFFIKPELREEIMAARRVYFEIFRWMRSRDEENMNIKILLRDADDKQFVTGVMLRVGDAIRNRMFKPSPIDSQDHFRYEPEDEFMSKIKTWLESQKVDILNAPKLSDEDVRFEAQANAIASRMAEMIKSPRRTDKKTIEITEMGFRLVLGVTTRSTEHLIRENPNLVGAIREGLLQNHGITVQKEDPSGATNDVREAIQSAVDGEGSEDQ